MIYPQTIFVKLLILKKYSLKKLEIFYYRIIMIFYTEKNLNLD